MNVHKGRPTIMGHFGLTYLPTQVRCFLYYSHLSNKRLPILENSTLNKTKIHPARLLISLQNFQYKMPECNVRTKPNEDFSHGHFEL